MEKQWKDSVAPGFTNEKVTDSQVSSKNTKHDSNDTRVMDGAGSAISNEIGHQLGLPDTSRDQKDKDSRNETGNKMDSPSRVPGTTNKDGQKVNRIITAEQRQQIINSIPEKK